MFRASWPSNIIIINMTIMYKLIGRPYNMLNKPEMCIYYLSLFNENKKVDAITCNLE